MPTFSKSVSLCGVHLCASIYDAKLPVSDVPHLPAIGGQNSRPARRLFYAAYSASPHLTG